MSYFPFFAYSFLCVLRASLVQLHFTQYSSLRTQHYYFLGLLSVNPTNRSPTIHQQPKPARSLKTVNANPAKELQNVLPKCNPFHSHMPDNMNWASCRGLP